MLNTLLKFGSHRVDYFDQTDGNPQAFAFYVRGGMAADERYSHEAKHQLYGGLAVIRTALGLENLAAVYIDIDELANFQRPAYQQMKKDLLAGMFNRVFVFDFSALLGEPAAEADLADLTAKVGGFELFSCGEDGGIFAREMLMNKALICCFEQVQS
jgi:hypothetical protein